MSDNSTLPATGDIIATDELATINGAGAVAGLKVQRMKIGFGSDGTLRDVDAANPLPASDALAQATLAEMRDLNVNLQYMMSAMLSKMPLINKSGRMRVIVAASETSDAELNSQYGGVSSNLVGEANTGRQYSRIYEPWNFCDMGATRLYDRINVS